MAKKKKKQAKRVRKNVVNVRFGNDGEDWIKVLEEAERLAGEREGLGEPMPRMYFIREALRGDADFIQAMKNLGIKEVHHPRRRGTHVRNVAGGKAKKG